jgi:hypothetical protein
MFLAVKLSAPDAPVPLHKLRDYLWSTSTDLESRNLDRDLAR